MITVAQDLAALDATDQSELVRSGQVSAAELVASAIERIERCNPELNAVIHDRFERARGEAAGALPDGPFRGVPFLLKDLAGGAAEGEPYHLGTRFLRDAGWKAPQSTTLVRRFRAAGLVDLGRTNVPELGAWTTTEPEAYGPTRNPWNPAHSSGGSSGGSAAAVASGMVPFAHASDGGGSIRIPASACGLVGLKTSRGRITQGPEVGESWAGMTVEFALTRSVRDCAALLDAVAGPAPGDPYAAPPPARPWAEAARTAPGRLRAGLLASSPRIDVHPECRAAAEGAARALEALGHDVVTVPPMEIGSVDRIVDVIAASQARDVERWGEALGREIGAEDMDPDNWRVTLRGRELTATRYLAGVEAVHRATRDIAAWWDAHGLDVLVTPTMPLPPAKLGELVPDAARPGQAFERSGAYTEFTIPFNVSGQPAVSLPLHWSADGLPIGVQVAGRPGAEDVLLALAGQLEAAHPWSHRRPAVWAGR